MEVALRQRLAGVAAIRISESDATTEVIFEPGDHPFSIDVFKGALRQADVEVETLQLEACGRVEAGPDGRRYMQAGGSLRLALNGPAVDAAASVCLAGSVRDEAGLATLTVERIDPADPAGD